MSPITRLRPLALATLAAATLAQLTVPAPAFAQLPEDGSFDVEFQAPGPPVDPILGTDLDDYFNRARCECETPFQVEINPPDGTFTDGLVVELWFGTACGDKTSQEQLDDDCVFVDQVDLLDVEGTHVYPTNAKQFITAGTDDVTSCDLPGEQGRQAYIMINEQGSRADVTYESVTRYPAEALTVDTRPPTGFTVSEGIVTDNVKVQAIEGGVEASWPGTDGVEYWQLLCQAQGAAAGEFPLEEPPENRYEVPATLEGCSAGKITAVAPAGRLRSVDQTLVVPPDLSVLRASTVCSAPAAGSSSSVSAKGLDNGTDYRVYLLAIDDARNPTVYDLGVVTPQPATDFWEYYEGEAEGGYCFVATATYGDYDHPYVRVLRDFRDDTLATNAIGRWLIDTYYANSPPLAEFIRHHEPARWVSRALLFPVVAAAGAWTYSGVLGKLGLLSLLPLLMALRRERRGRGATERVALRRGRRPLAAAVVGLLCLTAFETLASAQPYWDEPGGPGERLREEHGYEQSDWTFELKFGPYTPDIDSEDFPAGTPEKPVSQTPYADTFGGNRLMTQIEVDRYFLTALGQLGVGVGFGFMHASAQAFAQDANGGLVPDTSDPIDPSGFERAGEGNDTGFTLIPTSLLAVYRFTYLDDRFRVPLVPYAKGGLSYYVWRTTKPNGDEAAKLDDPMCDPSAEDADCKQLQGAGGTLGWQAAVGVAVRIERIDARSAQSLRNDVGVDHMAVFIEGNLARVNGLGMAKRLRVGDTTWLAGINFEF